MPIHRIPGPATLFLALLVLLVPSLSHAADPAPLSPMGSVLGRVVVAPDHRPSAYANVIVVGARRGAQADEQGRFRVPMVTPGPYRLRVAVLGARPLTREIEVGPGENDLGDIVIESPEDSAPDPVAIGALAAIGPGELEATIRPLKSKYHVGDTPEFHVRIRNRGEAPVFLVQSVDASDAWASPRVNIDIAGPDGGFVVAPLVRCGNNNGISVADFAEVGPGKEFDPYAGGWLDSKLRHGRFARPGRYEATFRYVTKETDPRRWLGGPCSNCDLAPTLRDLLARVPAVELTATTTFEVVK